ncbi:hypothetical protein AGLY_016059 [Aphis glycines]|uniref:Uncharacterized protein n=1 Tax=Aphis glycines TaxID=307491 RepID=A0A6G0T0S7_APHGL|nr:hypothetical protein AGLY_016059 [Aphis glycines]
MLWRIKVNINICRKFHLHLLVHNILLIFIFIFTMHLLKMSKYSINYYGVIYNISVKYVRVYERCWVGSCLPSNLLKGFTINHWIKWLADSGKETILNSNTVETRLTVTVGTRNRMYLKKTAYKTVVPNPQGTWSPRTDFFRWAFSIINFTVKYRYYSCTKSVQIENIRTFMFSLVEGNCLPMWPAEEKRLDITLSPVHFVIRIKFDCLMLTLISIQIRLPFYSSKPKSNDIYYYFKFQQCESKTTEKCCTVKGTDEKKLQSKIGLKPAPQCTISTTKKKKSR